MQRRQVSPPAAHISGKRLASVVSSARTAQEMRCRP